MRAFFATLNSGEKTGKLPVMRFADEHDRYYGVIHRVGRWFCKMFFDTSNEGRELHGRALPLIAREPEHIPDIIFGGPELPVDETTGRRFLASCKLGGGYAESNYGLDQRKGH